jgi:mannose/cellobiose epimerase-like protein (N-acyl-D-glucosamine 2-epimerase family)
MTRKIDCAVPPVRVQQDAQQVARFVYDMAVDSGREWLDNIEGCLENMLREVRDRKAQYKVLSESDHKTHRGYSHEQVLSGVVHYLVSYPSNFRLDLAVNRGADIVANRREMSK